MSAFALSMRMRSTNRTPPRTPMNKRYPRWQWAGGGLPLPKAKAPPTIARLVILSGPESHCQGSGSIVLRGGGGSWKLAVALLGAHTPFEKSALGSTDTSIHRLVGTLRFASDPSCLYCVVTSESRGVETTSPALRLGTWGGESRWCDRLSEVVTTSVAHLALSGK
jgi:hypothetical protein